MFLKSYSLRIYLYMLTLLPTLLIAILLGWYFSNLMSQHIESNLQQRGNSIIRELVSASRLNLPKKETRILKRLTDETLANDDLESITLFDSNGPVLAYSGPERFAPHAKPMTDSASIHIQRKTGFTEFTAPIYKKDVSYTIKIDEGTTKVVAPDKNVLGWARIVILHDHLLVQKYRNIFFIVTALLLGLGLCALFAAFLDQKIAQPIRRIQKKLAQINDGNLDVVIDTHGYGEIKQVEHGINVLSYQLKKTQQEMQDSIHEATEDLKLSLDTLEAQNIESEMARKEALESRRLKSEFIANMSHEIRAPMNGIIGFTNLLQDTPLQSYQSDYVKTIQTSANSLLNIINDILDFSKIEAGKLTLDHIPLNIRDCIDEVLTIMAPAAQRQGIELISFVYADVPQKMIGDPLRLKQIITNLVNNAIKYTEHGSVITRVMLESDENEQLKLRISVTDTGVGMSEAQQKNLFKAFSQADTKLTRRVGGTGLGLVIAKQLIQHMQGDIGLESELGRGSTFWFTFVCERTTLPSGIKYQDGPMNKKRALLFEENATALLALQHQLEQFKMNVVSVDNLSDLKQQFEQDNNTFDVVLFGTNQDYAQQSTVIQALDIARTNYQNTIIVMANRAKQTQTEHLHAHGADIILSKPVAQNKLHQQLSHLFSTPKTDTPAVIAEKIKESHLKATTNHPLLRVLAVDDEPINLQLLTILLEQMKVTVVPVNNGTQALRMAGRVDFDMIFVDLQMPDLSGIEVAHHIRQNAAKNKNTPIIAISASIMDNERAEIIAAGINDYLLKPINEAQLNNIIEKWHNNVDSKSPVPVATNHLDAEQRNTKIIDWALGTQLAGHNLELAKDMFQLLIERLSTEQADINRAFEEDNLKNLKDEVHKLHGALCYCGVPRLKSATATLHDALKQNADHSLIAERLEEFNEEIKLLLAAAQDESFLL